AYSICDLSRIDFRRRQLLCQCAIADNRTNEQPGKHQHVERKRGQVLLWQYAAFMHIHEIRYQLETDIGKPQWERERPQPAPGAFRHENIEPEEHVELIGKEQFEKNQYTQIDDKPR